MLNETKISRQRQRPGPWGQGQGFEVKAEGEANFLRSRPKPRPKIKFWIKGTKWWVTAYRWIYIIMIKMTLFNFSFSLTQQLSIFYHLSVYQQHCVVSKQTGQSLLDCWFICCRLRPGRDQMFEAKAEAEAKALRPRPRPRPKFWPRCHFGLEDLTSLALSGGWTVLAAEWLLVCSQT